METSTDTLLLFTLEDQDKDDHDDHDDNDHHDDHGVVFRYHLTCYI